MLIKLLFYAVVFVDDSKGAENVRELENNENMLNTFASLWIINRK